MKRTPLFISAALVALVLGGCATSPPMPAGDFLVGSGCGATACTQAAGLPAVQPGSAWNGASKKEMASACLQHCAPDYPVIKSWMDSGAWWGVTSNGSEIARALDPTIKLRQPQWNAQTKKEGQQ